MLRDRGTKQVLVAFHDAEFSGQLAHELLGAEMLPTLACSHGQLLGAATDQRYRLLITEPRIVDEEFLLALAMVRPRATLPVVVVGELENGANDPVSGLVDVVMPGQTPHGEIIMRCVRLIPITRPVRTPSVLNWGPLELDVGKRQASWRGRRVPLTPIQFRLMEILVLAGGDVVTNEQLSRRLWGDVIFTDAERIAAHVRRIRKKIEGDPSRPQFLLTVRGEGFRLDDTWMDEIHWGDRVGHIDIHE